MSKYIAITIASVCIFFGNAFAWVEGTQSPADPDWTISGNNIYAGVTGNVGIGKTNPTAKLDVEVPQGTAAHFKQVDDANTLPALSVIGNGSSQALDVYSWGSGEAGIFGLDILNSSDALVARTMGSGNAVYGHTTGTKRAGYFKIENPANTWPALYAETNGTGWGGSFANTNNGKGVWVYNILHIEPKVGIPDSPTEGDIFINLTLHHIYCYLGGTWKLLDN